MIKRSRLMLQVLSLSLLVAPSIKAATDEMYGNPLNFNISTLGGDTVIGSGTNTGSITIGSTSSGTLTLTSGGDLSINNVASTGDVTIGYDDGTGTFVTTTINGSIVFGTFGSVSPAATVTFNTPLSLSNIVGTPLNINTTGTGDTNIGNVTGGAITLSTGTNALSFNAGLTAGSEESGTVAIGNSVNGGNVTILTANANSVSLNGTGTGSVTIGSGTNTISLLGNSTFGSGTTAGAITTYSPITSGGSSALSLNTTGNNATTIGSLTGGAVTITAGIGSLDLESGNNGFIINTSGAGTISIGNASSGNMTLTTGGTFGATSTGAMTLTTTNTGSGAISLNGTAETGAITLGNAANTLNLASGTINMTNPFFSSGNPLMLDSANRVVTSTSSRRYKKNITRLSSEETRRVLDLESVKFYYRSDFNAQNVVHGWIAEDVYKVLPEAVIMKNGEPDGIYFNHILAAAVSELSRLHREVSDLKARNASLEDLVRLVIDRQDKINAAVEVLQVAASLVNDFNNNNSNDVDSNDVDSNDVDSNDVEVAN